MKKQKTEKLNKIKCSTCKKKFLCFHLHECERGIQEYFGCTVCDNWCTSCKPDWNDHDKKE